jgi:dimethylargininase
MRTLALTHLPSPALDHGLRTHVGRNPVDFGRALRQHADYCEMLRQCGAVVRILDVSRDLADSVFVEDTAVVLDEVAVLASMGDEARRTEPAGIERVLREYRQVERIEPPATLEGGDVLRVGRTLLVGLSGRTNAAGVSALEAVARRYNYDVRAIAVRGCLHLKTACTALDERRLLVNPAWLDVSRLRDFELVRVADSETWAANALRVGDTICLAAGHECTAQGIRQFGHDVLLTDISEFAKAEGGMTCLSLLIDLPDS